MDAKVGGIPPIMCDNHLLDKEVKHIIDEVKGMFQMQ